VQRRRGRAVPPSLPKLSGGTRQILTVVEELDIYLQWRREEARAPFSDPPVPLGEPSNPFPSAFVYLSARAAETRKVFQVMLDLGIVAEAFVRDADARLNESLRRGGIAVHETPPSMQFMLQRHHLVIHHGGIGTAQTALALGRPQLLVPRHFEQTLTAHRLVQLGVGAPFHSAPEWLKSAPRSMGSCAHPSCRAGPGQRRKKSLAESTALFWTCSATKRRERSAPELMLTYST
jgi:rhamnosyltransferase subunit B